MSTMAVRKKVAKKRNGGISPLHPVSQTQFIREERPPTALMQFIVSLEGELEYLDAIREFQEEWCDHPAEKQTISSTMYAPSSQQYSHTLKCNECGLLRHRSGRAPNASR
jgi:hypothetical protein